MAKGVLLPTFTAIASQMNFRLDAQPKSRTFLASKIQVFSPESLVASFSRASSSVTMTTGWSNAFFACSNRRRWAGVSTDLGLESVPVEATMWSEGTVNSTW